MLLTSSAHPFTMYIRKSMRDEEGFIKAMDAIFDKFKEQLAPVRVEFADNKIHISTQIEIQAGKLFEPKYHHCEYGELPSFIADKVAMLRTAGQGVDVDGIGKWRGNKLYYVQVSPKQWNQYHEARV